MKSRKRGRKPTKKAVPEYVAIGQRLLWSRLAIDEQTTQQDYAERADVQRTSYSEWETGVRRITLDGALALCKTYNLSLDWIFFGRIGTIDDEDLKKAIAAMRLSLSRHN